MEDQSMANPNPNQMEAERRYSARDVSAKMPGFQLVEKLGAQLDRYTTLRSTLEMALAPVMTPPIDEDAHPEEAPYHDLHTLILRLEQGNDQLQWIVGRIKL